MLNAMFKRFSCLLLLLIAATFSVQTIANAQVYQTAAKHAYLIDWNSGSVLFSKEEDEQVPPASLAKLMTLEVVFHALKTGELTLESEFYISEHAWRDGGANSGGSTMFAKLGSMVPLDALLHGIIVQSGNDACIAVAEGMAGNEETFCPADEQTSQGYRPHAFAFCQFHGATSRRAGGYSERSGQARTPSYR